MFQGLQQGHDYTERVLETSVRLMDSNALSLQSERKALDLLRQNQKTLSTSRVAQAERETIVRRLTQVDALLQFVEASSRLLGPVAEKQTAEIDDIDSQMKNLLALSANTPDLRDRLTELVLLIKLGAGSTDQVRQIDAFCENFAKRLRHEEGVQKTLTR
jgi:hypothetical protein